MHVNKHGIPVQSPVKSQKHVPPNFKLGNLQMSKAVEGKQQQITVPNFQPVQQVLTAYGWELRDC